MRCSRDVLAKPDHRQWRAHGRYIARDAANARPRSRAFGDQGEGVAPPEVLDRRQKAGDPRLWKMMISPEFGERIDLNRIHRARNPERGCERTPLFWHRTLTFSGYYGPVVNSSDVSGRLDVGQLECLAGWTPWGCDGRIWARARRRPWNGVGCRDLCPVPEPAAGCPAECEGGERAVFCDCTCAEDADGTGEEGYDYRGGG